MYFSSKMYKRLPTKFRSDYCDNWSISMTRKSIEHLSPTRSEQFPGGLQEGMLHLLRMKKWLPEWEVLLLPSWVSDWLWLTGVRSWQLWVGESLPAGSVPDGFSMFFISISSWWIQRSGGRSSFWLPFRLPTLWVARFLGNRVRRQTWESPSIAFFSFFLSQFSSKLLSKQKDSQEGACETRNWQACLGVISASPLETQRRTGDVVLNSQGPWLSARVLPTPALPTANPHTRWQWVTWSHMPIFGGRHKVPDCNICLGDKWRSCLKRANRNKKARTCANS